jgi:hypothetical protein
LHQSDKSDPELDPFRKEKPDTDPDRIHSVLCGSATLGKIHQYSIKGILEGLRDYSYSFIMYLFSNPLGFLDALLFSATESMNDL